MRASGDPELHNPVRHGALIRSRVRAGSELGSSAESGRARSRDEASARVVRVVGRSTSSCEQASPQRRRVLSSIGSSHFPSQPTSPSMMRTLAIFRSRRLLARAQNAALRLMRPRGLIWSSTHRMRTLLAGIAADGGARTLCAIRQRSAGLVVDSDDARPGVPFQRPETRTRPSASGVSALPTESATLRK